MTFKNQLMFWGIIALLFSSCGDSTSTTSDKVDDTVITHQLSDPEEMTPLNANDNGSTIISYAIFQNLLHIDFKTNQIVPVLAKERPVITKQDDGRVTVDMEIRPEAKWDNGEAITGNDVAFSFKVLKNPETKSKALKPYFDKVMDVIVDKENPKKFTILYAEPYMIIESSLSDFYIIPSYVYDPDNIMAKFTVKELYEDAKGAKELKNNAEIKRFAEQYNGPKFQREVVIGSGPYNFDRWETNQRVVVTLKKDWWGHSVPDKNHWFEAYPSKIIYESINDLATATVALKGEKLDAMYGIKNKDFVDDLRKSDNFKAKYNTFTPPKFSYDYLAINLRLEKFKDVRTRKAMAHIMNVPQLIESYCYGLGEPVSCFTHPSLKERLNPNVKPYPHDLEKAKALLAEAGWKDSNSDGTLDQEFDGKVEDFTITLNYNSGNKRRETACLIFQEAARKVGVKVEVVSLDWGVITENLKVHKFETVVLGWISSPFESDPKQIWHTDSANEEGSNYTGFGNAASDQLIEDLRVELDPQKRYKMYHKLHQIIHDEIPYIFLLAEKERIAIHSRFGNSYGSGIRPGYWTNGFTVSQPVAN